METILAIARSGLTTAVVVLNKKAKSTADAKKKAKFTKAAKACSAAAVALDELLSDPDL